jgi:hypothetical protein
MLWHSAVVWLWCFNGLRLGFGLILLPLVLRKLSTPDLGMYYVLLNLAGLVIMIDFGFGGTIARFVSYAAGGAASLQAQGIAPPAGAASPNLPLLWQLLRATRTLYGYLSWVVLVVLGLWGTYTVELRIHETSSAMVTRLAWAATLAATLADIYSSWWSVYLRGLNQVLAAARVGVAALIVKFLISVGLLLAGAGLLSIPIATLISSLVQRHLARVRCLAWLKDRPPDQPEAFREILRLLWPNTWRLGVQFMSTSILSNALTTACLFFFGLRANAAYGLSTQLMNIALGMASVWTQTKWPVIAQHLSRHEPAPVRAILRPRVWLQSMTFLLLAGGVVACGPALLHRFGSGKEMLPAPWMGWLLCLTFLEMQFSLWTTLIASENRLPYLWPTVATHTLSLALMLGLIRYTELGLGALVLGPLLAGLPFNYWYWPAHAARRIQTGLPALLFRRERA